MSVGVRMAVDVAPFLVRPLAVVDMRLGSDEQFDGGQPLGRVQIPQCSHQGRLAESLVVSARRGVGVGVAVGEKDGDDGHVAMSDGVEERGEAGVVEAVNGRVGVLRWVMMGGDD